MTNDFGDEVDVPVPPDRIDNHVRNDARRWKYLVWALIAEFIVICVLSVSGLSLLSRIRDNTEDATFAANKANTAALRVDAVAEQTKMASRHSTIALCSLTHYLDTVVDQSKKLIQQDPDPARRATRLKQLVLTDVLLAELHNAVGDDCPSRKTS